MSDLRCPYCNTEHEVCHDDGAGYAEDIAHEMQCGSCEKNFVFFTTIVLRYQPQKADCLNGQPHILSAVSHYPRYWPEWVRCRDCDYEKRGELDTSAHP